MRDEKIQPRSTQFVERDSNMNWHRFFGLLLTDFFYGSPFRVDLEIDLSLKQQFLDVVILRKQEGLFSGQLPDGMDSLAEYNLISFKSFQESFDPWTMKELIGHYVSYRKQISHDFKALIPEEHFRLFGVTARFPSLLASKVELKPIQEGVYDCEWGTDLVRLIVLRELPLEDRNAVLQLFSAIPEQIRFARDHYRQRYINSSSLIQQLLIYYEKEGLAMPYTMEDFDREVKRGTLEKLTLQERKEFVQEQPPEVRLEGLSPEVRLEGLSVDTRLEGIPPQDILAKLSPSEIEAYLKKLREEASQSEPS